ncbi:MAG: MFS transporter, partial [Pseudonocardia sp.]
DRLPPSGSPLRSIGRVLAQRWARVVLLFALVEGAVVLGLLTYLAPAVQALGATAALAGTVAASYGVGALLFTRVVRRLVGRLTAATLAAIGGAFLVAAWGVPALGVSIVTVAVAGLLVGGSWAFLHSTLQTWATQVVPKERATTVALFAAMLFLGSGLGTALAAHPAGAGAYPELFRAGLVAALPLGIAVAAARARYARATRT